MNNENQLSWNVSTVIVVILAFFAAIFWVAFDPIYQAFKPAPKHTDAL